MKPQNLSTKKDNSCLTKTLSVAKKRVLSDLLAMPFLFLWSLAICLLIEKASNKNINLYLQDTFSEGVSIKTLMGMLVLSIFLMGLAWIIRPSFESALYRMLVEPMKAARSVCITTIAFLLGLSFSIIITNGLAEAKKMAVPVIILASLWVLINIVEALTYEASEHYETNYKTPTRIIGSIMIAGCIVIIYIIYGGIQSGEFLPSP